MMIFISQVDLATCSAYIGEECEYSGDRLGKIGFNIKLSYIGKSKHFVVQLTVSLNSKINIFRKVYSIFYTYNIAECCHSFIISKT